MDELWKLGMASVGEIRQGLPERKRPAYTTVQTIVNRLEDKGAVRRVKKVGNAYVYEAVVTKDAAHRRLINELLDLLGGSRPLMAHLVDDGKVSLEDLHGLEAQLEAQSRAKKGS